MFTYSNTNLPPSSFDLQNVDSLVPIFDKLYPGKSLVKGKLTKWAETFGLDLQYVVGEFSYASAQCTPD